MDRWWVAVACAVLALSGSARAGDEPPAQDPAVDTVTAEAKAAFELGTSLTKEQRWAEALAAFERASALRPHPVTTYNVAFCLRALGHYTRALRAFRRTLDENAGATASLPQELLDRIADYIAEIDRLLARFEVTLEPSDARLLVDGRPLAAGDGSTDAAPVLVAGVLPAGEATSPGHARFMLVLEPGAHVLQLLRKGFSTAVVKVDAKPGERRELALRADKLPAELRIESEPAGAAVQVDERDVGVTPIVIARPEGSYRLRLTLDGYDDYETNVRLAPGQQTDLDAHLVVYEPSVVEQWWFWTIAATVVAGVAVGTYFATRPEP
jgi:tetratricopeptide (TPR) repeat protein